MVFCKVWHKNLSQHQARRQSTVKGHIPKGVWVSQEIAGGELYVFRQPKCQKEDYDD